MRSSGDLLTASQLQGLDGGTKRVVHLETTDGAGEASANEVIGDVETARNLGVGEFVEQPETDDLAMLNRELVERGAELLSRMFSGVVSLDSLKRPLGIFLGREAEACQCVEFYPARPAVGAKHCMSDAPDPRSRLRFGCPPELVALLEGFGEGLGHEVHSRVAIADSFGEVAKDAPGKAIVKIGKGLAGVFGQREERLRWPVVAYGARV